MGWTSQTKPPPHLVLLDEVCARSLRLRMRLVSPENDAPTIYTRFLRLRKDGLLLYWPTHTGLELTEGKHRVEVFFEHAGQRLAFLTDTNGRTVHAFENGAQALALRLITPLSVQRRQQREAFRVSLLDLDQPLFADLTPIERDDAAALRLQLNNLSTGGIGGVMELAKDQVPQRRAVYQASIDLRDEEGGLAALVELRQARLIDAELNRHYLGWQFCTPDDAVAAREQLRRLERFVAERQRAQARRAIT